MKTTSYLNHSFEFYFSDSDTQLLVEEAEGRVVIHATRNTFSDRRKKCFLRHLAAEGFIPDRYQWTSDVKSEWPQVSWLVDNSWLRLHNGHPARARIFMVRLLASSALLWLVMMTAVVLGWI